jgi:hypothetical protein
VFTISLNKSVGVEQQLTTGEGGGGIVPPGAPMLKSQECKSERIELNIWLSCEGELI